MLFSKTIKFINDQSQEKEILKYFDFMLSIDIIGMNNDY